MLQFQHWSQQWGLLSLIALVSTCTIWLELNKKTNWLDITKSNGLLYTRLSYLSFRQHPSLTWVFSFPCCRIFSTVFSPFLFMESPTTIHKWEKRNIIACTLCTTYHMIIHKLVIKRNVPYGLVQLKLHNPTTVWATNQHSFIPFFIDWLNDLC